MAEIGVSGKWGILSGNQLKILALVAMTCDHVGKELLPEYEFLQIIGRLAFPIFAYMIAEGCRYTRNRRKHLLQVAVLALSCQIVYFVIERSLFQCILVTFSLSIGLIYVLEYARKKRTAAAWLEATAVCGVVWFFCVIMPIVLKGSDFAVDYGIWGILLPVVVYFVPEKLEIPAVIAMLVLLCVELGGIQRYALLAVPLLSLYSGKKGKANMKHLFLTYYPVHLVCIYMLSLLLNTNS